MDLLDDIAMPFSAVYRPRENNGYLQVIEEHRNGGSLSTRLRIPSGVSTVSVAWHQDVRVTLRHYITTNNDIGVEKHIERGGGDGFPRHSRGILRNHLPRGHSGVFGTGRCGRLSGCHGHSDQPAVALAVV